LGTDATEGGDEVIGDGGMRGASRALQSSSLHAPEMARGDPILVVWVGQANDVN
jgi:hypothetical protein